MSIADDTLARINAAVGVVAGAFGLVFLLFTKLPASAQLPVALGSAALLLLPLFLPMSLSLMQGSHVAMVRYVQYGCWALTLLLLASLIAAALVWGTLPSRIAATVGIRGIPSHPSITAELEAGLTSESSFAYTAPDAAFDSWSQSLGLDRGSPVPVVGILREVPTQAGEARSFSFRVYPAAEFFSEARGPIAFFEQVLGAWLLILLVIQLFLFLLIPFAARILRTFADTSSDARATQDAEATGPVPREAEDA
ncbi:MAG: hypothetical protein IT431_15520 [Phycisphaerales bacterium]|nr:hypothetical protein [Phycisphaerales bacterium]